MRAWIWLALFAVLGPCLTAFPEAKNDYPGVADPFADPSQYEFADDEKEDKEFFHLGRFFMLGFDVGTAIFTGGLGTTTAPGLLVGGRVLYFFDKLIALEGMAHYSMHQDNPGTFDADVAILSYGAGLRYYFDINNAPRAIAIANPYLSLAAAGYQRQFNKVGGSGTPPADSIAFGASLGAGAEFLVYRKHVYLGLDLRYHFVFFLDENTSISAPGDRAGDYFTAAMTVNYNF
ncbi:porin family protein [bacterium]|nr:porin family protein [bacterium]